MDNYLKATAGVLIALVLYLVLSRNQKDISLLLSIFVCCMVAVFAVNTLQPVFNFLRRLEDLGELDHEMVSVVFKVVGIGLLGEITNTICTDAGNAALGKSLQLLASAVMLCLSTPLFEGLIELIEEILVAI